MPKLKHYRINPETLKVEVEEVSRHRFAKFVAVVLAGALLFVGILWLYVSVLGLDLPKTAILSFSLAFSGCMFQSSDSISPKRRSSSGRTWNGPPAWK